MLQHWPPWAGMFWHLTTSGSFLLPMDVAFVCHWWHSLIENLQTSCCGLEEIKLRLSEMKFLKVSAMILTSQCSMKIFLKSISVFIFAILIVNSISSARICVKTVELPPHVSKRLNRIWNWWQQNAVEPFVWPRLTDKASIDHGMVP